MRSARCPASESFSVIGTVAQSSALPARRLKVETKAKPSPEGCYARALPDEPMFILLGRDRCAPDAIRRWADERTRLAIEEDWSEDPERITDAVDTADAMERWRVEHEGAWRRSVTAMDVPEADLSDIALRVLRRAPALGILATDVPASAGRMVAVEAFNTLLADAQKLAAQVAQYNLLETVVG
jgi:hypothetical protein